MELRNYQKDQLDFLEKNHKNRLPIAIESPTGSGKSVVILEYVKRLFEKEEGLDVVITTGFNNLVWDFRDKAISYGLDPDVWVGTSFLTCEKKSDLVFSEDDSLRCESNCGCKKSERYNFFRKGQLNKGKKNRLFIMNHSSFLIHSISNIKSINPDIVIVDESHTFSNFYEGFIGSKLTSKEVRILDKILGDNDPMLRVMKNLAVMNMEIPQKLISNLCERIMKIDSINNKKVSYSFKQGLCFKLKKISKMAFESDMNTAFSMTDGEIRKDVFYTSFDVKQSFIKYILFSGTQDLFTRNMFGVNNSNFYKQKGLNIIDYRESEYLLVKKTDFIDGLKVFMDEVNKRDLSSGMILSTTNENIKRIAENKEILEGFKVFSDINSFKNYKGKKILVGSKALFQGVDIYGIEFLCLNRIPFDKYDTIFKKKAKYLKDVGRINPWTEFTLPYVGNTIIQASGRIWRRPGDKGLFSIMDPRLDDKFSYMNKYVTDVRNGIKFRKIGEDKEVLEEEKIEEN